MSDRYTAADMVTLVGYGLGVWWCLGGPRWAGLASILADEVDGDLARAHGASARGSALDWGADVALTPLALARGAKAVGVSPLLGAFFAPGVLAAQASMRAAGERPVVGSARAAVMLATMVAEELSDGRG